MTLYLSKMPQSELPYTVAADWDYSRQMVEAVKREVPAPFRTWQPARKRWMFTPEAVPIVEELGRRICGGVQWFDPDAVAALIPVRNQPDEAHRALFVTNDAPLEVIEAVYKTLAKRVHPDVGGTDEDMKRLNAARDRILERSRGNG